MSTTNDSTYPPTSRSIDIADYFKKMQEKCAFVFTESLAGENLALTARGHIFANEIGLWCDVLSNRREVELLKMSALEHEFALLALTQGFYRHAFKGLRLVFELALQSVYLSANELCLREWLDNRSDTVWNAIVNEDQGVFSERFTKAFFPELAVHINHYRGLARTIYRECSECVHGNTPKYVPLPSALIFDQNVFNLWFEKSDIIAMVSHFALALRYLPELNESEVSMLEITLSSRIGHIDAIRHLIGGRKE